MVKRLMSKKKGGGGKEQENKSNRLHVLFTFKLNQSFCFLFFFSTILVSLILCVEYRDLVCLLAVDAYYHHSEFFFRSFWKR